MQRLLILLYVTSKNMIKGMLVENQVSDLTEQQCMIFKNQNLLKKSKAFHKRSKNRIKPSD